MAADIITMGMDVGSTTSKCLILRGGEAVLGSSIVAAGTGTSGPERALRTALTQAGIEECAVSAVAATGYGRARYEKAQYRVSELSAHALGAARLFPGVRTVIDIGGQDAKVIRVSEAGTLENFIMNDKCAAGTGRFLEVMARILELDVSELADYDARANSAAEISSTCTVFAESEVISQLSNGADIASVCAGIHASVAVRTAALARRLGVAEPAAMTGGVAKNAGVVRALERELGIKLAVSPDCQSAGALGAAIYAWNKVKE